MALQYLVALTGAYLIHTVSFILLDQQQQPANPDLFTLNLGCPYVRLVSAPETSSVEFRGLFLHLGSFDPPQQADGANDAGHCD